MANRQSKDLDIYEEEERIKVKELRIKRCKKACSIFVCLAIMISLSVIQMMIAIFKG